MVFLEVGFWRSGRHLVLEDGFDYPENDTWLNQYIVADEGGELKVYILWIYDYSFETITRVLENMGLKVEQTWNSLSGEPYNEGEDWMAVVVRIV